jgi:hypothetical protein
VLPGNHDIGDNPTETAPALGLVCEARRQSFLAAFGMDRCHIEAGGWSLVRLNGLLLNSGLASEQEQEDWLRSELAHFRGRPVALFIHRPMFRIVPEAPNAERPASAMRPCRRGNG